MSNFKLAHFVKHVLASTVIVSVYAALYSYVYNLYLAPIYGYLGFYNYSQSFSETATALICIILAIPILPNRIAKASDFFLWFVFILVYLPAQITVSKMGTIPGGSQALSFSLLVSLFGLALVPRLIPQFSIQVRQFQIFSNRKTMVGIALICIAIVVAKYHPIMSLVGVDGIYEQRAAASAAGSSRFIGYILNWLAYVFAGFFFAIGLFNNLRFYKVLGFTCLLVVYMITAAKITFVVLGAILFIHALLKAGLLKRPYLLALLPIAPLSAVSILFQVSGIHLSGYILFFVSQIIMRGIGIQAVAFGLYVEFFSSNAKTFYSHITGFNAFIHYPYDLALGQVVGEWQSGNPGYNANSGFWATDGFAAAGYLGLIVIGPVLGVIFLVINALSCRTNLHFLCLVMTPFCLAAANTSIFTALVTGGGLLIFLLSGYVQPKYYGVDAP